MARSDDNAEAGSHAVRGRRLPAHVMRSALVVCVAWLAACGDPKATTIDAPQEATWWQPKVGDAKNWDIQLGAPIDVSEPRTMYDLDLWALVPSPTMIDYRDGDPVMVPAGPLAGTIAWLHGRTPSTIVICHVDTGALDLSLPDARKFPGYKADPTQIPDNPMAIPAPAVPGAPEPGSVIGWRLDAPTRRWLDIRDIRGAGRSKWSDIMFKRFDLAAQIGCDGVEPDFNFAVAFESSAGGPGTGFSIPAPDSYSWHDEIANQGHARMLSTGMKDGDLVPDQVDKGADEFDWLMVERCGEGMSCDNMRPFTNLQKAVFAIDYDHDGTGDPQSSDVVCPLQKTQEGTVLDGIYKDVALTSKVRTQCKP